MMRLIGGVMLTMGSTLFGFEMVRRLERRVQDLTELSAGLNGIKRELDWRMLPLPDLLKQAGQETKGRCSEFFSQCGQAAAHPDGKIFCQIWVRKLKEAQFQLTPADLTILERLGGVLGRYDAECQCAVMNETLAHLEDQRRQAIERRERLGKVYAALGIASGAFMTILLI